MEKGREGKDSGSEVWGGGKERKQKYGVGGRGQEKTELGGEWGREGDRDEGCIRLQDSSEQCPNPLQCMLLSLPLPRGQYSCSGTVPDM